MWVGVVLDLDDHSNALLGRLVPNVANADDDFLVDQISNLNEHVGFFDLVGDFVNHDTFAVLVVKDLALCTNVKPPFSGGVHVGDAVNAVNGCTGWEIRALDVLHVFFYRNRGLVVRAGFQDGVDVKIHRTGHLRQVVGWNSGGHTDRNTVTSIEQKIGEPSGKDGGFVLRIVKVRLEINRVLVDVVEHVLGDSVQATFRVSHGSGRIAVDGAKVALTVNKRIAQGKLLSHSNHGVVNGLVAVRVVLPHDLTHRPSGFAEFLVGRMTALEHAVKHASVDGFEAVPSIGQRTADDDGHGVVDVGIFHFGVERMVQDDFAGAGRSVVLDVVFFRCQGWSPPWRVAQ